MHISKHALYPINIYNYYLSFKIKLKYFKGDIRNDKENSLSYSLK